MKRATRIRRGFDKPTHLMSGHSMVAGSKPGNQLLRDLGTSGPNAVISESRRDCRTEHGNLQRFGVDGQLELLTALR